MKGIIAAAGRGTRLYPIGITTSKTLVKILNKSIIEWSIDALKQNGINEVIIIISADEFGEQVRNHLENANIDGVNLQFATQKEQLGTAHVFQMAKELVDECEDFVALYGDDLYGPDNIRALLEHELAIIGKKVTDPEKWGILQHDEQGNLIKLVEKPKEMIGDLAHIGCMKLNARIFDFFDQLEMTERREYELTDSITMLANERPVKVIEAVDYWLPVGYPWHILDATEVLAPKVESKIEGEVEQNVVVKGKLILPASSKILANTYIDGNLIVGENTTIGPNVMIRGDVVIGNDCWIKFNSEIKNTVIGDSCKIHSGYIGDSIFGNHINFPTSIAGSYLGSFPVARVGSDPEENTNVKTLVKNNYVNTSRHKFGAVIGDSVQIGINTVIFPGIKIWPGAVTSPNEVVKNDIVNKWV